MSGDGELEIPFVSCVRWTIDSEEDDTLFSHVFQFQKDEWYLSYYFEDRDSCHHLTLIKKSRGRNSFAPFDVSVHVGAGGTNRIVTEGLSEKKCFGAPEDTVAYVLWGRRDTDIERAYPEFGLNPELRFLVELKVNGEDVAEDIDFRALKAECSFFNAAGEDGCTRSTSVQTTMLSSTISCLENLSEDLTQMLVQASDSDVELRCFGQTIKAHKLIVCQRSPVIASMLASDMVEGRTSVVKIRNMEHDIFSQFMRYIYSGQLRELTFDTALKLYEAGDQYEVLCLAKKCSEFLLDHLSIDNACEVLAIADAHSNKDFAEKVFDYVVDKRVPLVWEDWSYFCKEHTDLALKVLHRGWKVFAK